LTFARSLCTLSALFQGSQVKIPKGFGKNYFSLSAICAHSSSAKLHAQCSAFTHISRNTSFANLEEEDDPLLELEMLIQENEFLSISSSCHCNCIFKNRLYTLLQYFKFIQQTFFIFNKNRSGISPPFSFLRPHHKLI